MVIDIDYSKNFNDIALELYEKYRFRKTEKTHYSIFIDNDDKSEIMCVKYYAFYYLKIIICKKSIVEEIRIHNLDDAAILLFSNKTLSKRYFINNIEYDKVNWFIERAKYVCNNR